MLVLNASYPITNAAILLWVFPSSPLKWMTIFFNVSISWHCLLNISLALPLMAFNFCITRMFLSFFPSCVSPMWVFMFVCVGCSSCSSRFTSSHGFLCLNGCPLLLYLVLVSSALSKKFAATLIIVQRVMLSFLLIPLRALVRCGLGIWPRCLLDVS